MSETLADALRVECDKLAEYRADGFAQIPLATALKAMMRVADAARPYTDWLSEGEAKLRSNRPEAWLRSRFPAWETQGLARWNPNKPKSRQYLRCAIPLRANPDAAREEGLRVDVG